MNAKCVLSSRLAGAALLAMSFAAVSTHAQDYPSKPIRMMVPFAAAGILDIATILNLPEMQERFRTQGVDLVSSTPKAFAAFIRAELTKWRKVVKESGATIG